METTGRSQEHDLAAVALAIPLVLIGVLSVVSGDFAYQWQPVSPGIVHRPELAIAFGALLAVSAAAMPLTVRWAALPLAIIMSVWVLTMQLPRVVATPADFTTWLGLAEISAIATGAWTVHAGRYRKGWAEGSMPVLRRGFGVTLVVFGASHFLFARFTATMVPSFLPFPLILAYLTGAVHAGAGIMLLTGWRLRAAAGVEAAMMASFAALVHVPRVSRSPSSRLEWTMLAIALALTGAAAAVATRRFGITRSSDWRQEPAAGH